MQEQTRFSKAIQQLKRKLQYDLDQKEIAKLDQRYGYAELKDDDLNIVYNRDDLPTFIGE